MRYILLLIITLLAACSDSTTVAYRVKSLKDSTIDIKYLDPYFLPGDTISLALSAVKDEKYVILAKCDTIK